MNMRKFLSKLITFTSLLCVNSKKDIRTTEKEFRYEIEKKIIKELVDDGIRSLAVINNEGC